MSSENALQKLFSPKNMTDGEPWRRLVEFAVPMLIGNIAQQLYSTVDSIVIGRYEGDTALAAVGSSMPIMTIIFALFIGVATGAGILVAQNFGARDREALSDTIGNCIVLTAMVGILAAILGNIIISPLLRLLNTPDSLFAMASQYLKIVVTGMAGFFFYNIMSGILRGMGDSLSALVFLLIACGLNIGLDIWFVAGFKWGIAGVAIATIISQTISAICCFLKLRSMRQTFDMSLKRFKPKKEYMSHILKLGLPSGLTQAIMSFGMMAVQSLTNSFGEMAIAANVMVVRVDGFAMMPNMTFGMTVTTFVGQNVGAGRLDRVKQGVKQGTLIATAMSAVITCMLLLFGKNLMSIFSETQDLISLAYNMLCILAVGYVISSVMMCLSGAMRGAGDTVTPMWISLLSSIIIRVPLAYLFAYLTRCPEFPNGRPQSTYISMLISWTIGVIITVIVYKNGKWREKAKRRPMAEKPEAPLEEAPVETTAE